jgi:predicted amidohydrolase YtcJ
LNGSASTLRLPLAGSIAIVVLATSTHAFAADLVLRNGHIHTVSASQPMAEAVAIEAGRITEVGTNVESTRWVGPATRVIDLHGEVVYPGFKDSHAHLLELGLSHLRVDLTGARDFDEVVARVRRVAASKPPDTWILGNGWHEEKWTHLPSDAAHGFPVHQALSAAIPKNPVVLERADGHALLANARAMELMQISAKTFSPPGGQIIHDATGQLTGIFIDDAMDLIKVPDPSVETRRKAWDLAFREALHSGITAADEPGLSLEDVTLIKQIAAEDRIPIRLYAMLGGWSVLQHFERPEIGLDHGFLTRCQAVRGRSVGFPGSCRFARSPMAWVAT